MPFISKDWRSPGELWVKTKGGTWEKVKILQFLRSFDQDVEQPCKYITQDVHSNGSSSSNNSTSTTTSKSSSNNGSTTSINNNNDDGTLSSEFVPHVQVTIRKTREIPYKNTLSEALLQLDFPSACRDIRRFNYTSKILNLLISQNLTHMGGSAQRVLITLLEHIAAYVKENNNCGSDIIKLLLTEFRDCLLKYNCWGRPLGSTYLWDEHKQRLEKLNEFEKEEFLCQSGDLHELPEEVVREIILKLNHHFDLNNLSTSSDLFKKLISESRIWREMCEYHFTDEQVTQMVQNSNNNGNISWEDIYHKLKRKYGLVEKYAEEINLCKTCRTLFWPSYGHSCPSTPEIKSLKPEDFIQLFSL